MGVLGSFDLVRTGAAATRPQSGHSVGQRMIPKPALRLGGRVAAAFGWEAAWLLLGRGHIQPIWSVFLLDPEDEGVLSIKPDYATIESSTRHRVPAERVPDPISIAQEGSVVRQVSECFFSFADEPGGR